VLLAEHAAQRGYRLREVVVLDDRARPQGLRERLPRYRFAGALDEIDERVEWLGRERYGPAVGPLQPAVPWVETKAAEFVDRSCYPEVSSCLF
jgi:hypothetical protein